MLLAILLATTLRLASSSTLRNDAFVGYSEVPLLVPALDGDYLIFVTKYGEIKVELTFASSPRTVALVKELALQGVYDGCSFYRAEPPGETYDKGSRLARKGYALVQGGLYSCGKQKEVNLPLEAKLKITKGTVSIIPGTSEFFFSLEDHPEWDGSFSVWGKVVEGLKVLETIAALPTVQEVHPSGTVLRILETPVGFRLSGRFLTAVKRSFCPCKTGRSYLPVSRNVRA